ncbi:hypothetical protein [Croceibacterium aestuarii]|uniref:hypothetical protein n=1 Tax=Croceibacterium aestuarii TaxID=3064139 RepID=UPI00272E9F27|nr:hypothetical protein [Croceibacterium sp. D39]
MSNLKNGLGWAGAMLLVAAGARFGFMDRDAALTLLLVLPILAIASLRDRVCHPRSAS